VACGVVYGGAVFSIFFSDPMISWETHVAGIISGVVCAFFYHKVVSILLEKNWKIEDIIKGKKEEKIDVIELDEDGDQVEILEEHPLTVESDKVGNMDRDFVVAIENEDDSSGELKTDINVNVDIPNYDKDVSLWLKQNKQI